ncbi:MAG TPA: glycosyltransferase family 2 protein [Myxococcota bacterium]|nr:glycosyltransferase family 2 protein [Myxococcota bacterium]
MGHDRRVEAAVTVLKLGLSVPLYDEEDCCEEVVADILTALGAAGIPHTLALVDNGSTDGTLAIIERLAIEHQDVLVVRLQDNAGYGGGILAGLQQLDTPILGWCWGDGQVPPEVLVEAYRLLVEGCDLAKARRTVRLDGAQRRAVTRVYNAVMALGFGLDTSDVNGCPKLMTREAFEALQLRSKDWFLDPECMLGAKKLGLRVAEVEAVMRPRFGGASKVRGETITEFLRHLWAWRRGWRP